MSAHTAFRPAKRYVDLFEQMLVVVLYAWLVMRLWPGPISSANWYSLLILLSEGLVVVLLVIRRKTDLISMNFSDWAVAFGGTFLVLMVAKGGPPLWGGGGVLFLVVGIFIHVGAKLSLLRSFGLVAADRGVKLHGLYAVVRHPMYAGYMLTHIGFLMVAPSWWNLGLYCAVWALFIARISAEEGVLGANPEYRAYKVNVRYRLVPGLY